MYELGQSESTSEGDDEDSSSCSSNSRAGDEDQEEQATGAGITLNTASLVDGGKRMLNTVRQNLKRSKRVENNQNNSQEVIRFDSAGIRRRDL